MRNLKMKFRRIELEMSQTELIEAAQSAYDEAQDALKDGNWSEYGKHMDELEKYLNKLAK